MREIDIIMEVLEDDFTISILIYVYALQIFFYNGPLQNVWNPDDYVKNLILNHRAANDNKSKNVFKNVEEMYNKTDIL